MSTINLITYRTKIPDAEPSLLRELDARTGDGVTVRLLWDPQTDRAAVEVECVDSRERFTVSCDAEDNPLDVFYHPYFYAALRSPSGA